MVLLVALLGCSEPKPVEPVLALEGSAQRGEARYQMECARCHGASGGGAGGAPALSGRVHELPDAEVVDTMLNGRGAMMGLRLTDRQAADILAYLRETFPK